ncbi:MAG: FkbM family methyltransferase [Candidatus Acidiferrales bacterium]
MIDSVMYSFGVRKTLRIPAEEWSVVCHPHAYRCAYESQISDPEQHEEFRVFRAYCNKQMVLFDIGAHFGVFSLAAARIGGRAVAVDPSPMATRMIATQAELNGFTERIHVLRAAVGSVDGSIELLSSGTFAYGYFRAARGRLKRDLTEVRSVTIDSMTREFGPPTHIKIDVEGYEGEVLRGARDTLTLCSPLLFLELHNDIIRAEGGNPHLALEQLTKAGYILCTLAGDQVPASALAGTSLVRFIARRD